MFLSRQLFSAPTIYEQLVAILGLNTITYYTMPKYLKETRWTAGKGENPEMDDLDVVDQIILAALEERPFLLMQELAKRTCVTFFTVHWRFTNSMGFVVKHLRWIPHKLNEAQLEARAHISNQLLKITRSIEHHGW
jgi:hypothetical protein